MRPTWTQRIGIASALIGLAGCSSSGISLRTPVPEQYVLPPSGDPRFSSPPEFPRETLNQAPVKPAAGTTNLPSQRPQLAPNGQNGRVGGVPGGL